MKTNFILSMLYPPVCPVCSGILRPCDGLIHSACEKKLLYVNEPTCLRCGKPIERAEEEFCFDCGRRASVIDGGASVWVYTKEMSHSIAMYKYHNKKEFAPFYFDRILKRYGQWIMRKNPDCITAVPLNSRKERYRGYNQSYIIAKMLGNALGIPVEKSLLVRSRYTEPQKSLTPEQRLKNLQKAFRPGKNVCKYKKVLLVDDIYTTGSTMNICSSILKSCGVEKVWILSLCIGSDF